MGLLSIFKRHKVVTDELTKKAKVATKENEAAMERLLEKISRDSLKDILKVK